MSSVLHMSTFKRIAFILNKEEFNKIHFFTRARKGMVEIDNSGVRFLTDPGELLAIDFTDIRSAKLATERTQWWYWLLLVFPLVAGVLYGLVMSPSAFAALSINNWIQYLLVCVVIAVVFYPTFFMRTWTEVLLHNGDALYISFDWRMNPDIFKSMQRQQEFLFWWVNWGDCKQVVKILNAATARLETKV